MARKAEAEAMAKKAEAEAEVKKAEAEATARKAEAEAMARKAEIDGEIESKRIALEEKRLDIELESLVQRRMTDEPDAKRQRFVLFRCSVTSSLDDLVTEPMKDRLRRLNQRHRRPRQLLFPTGFNAITPRYQPLYFFRHRCEPTPLPTTPLPTSPIIAQLPTPTITPYVTSLFFFFAVSDLSSQRATL